ncbi:MAG: transposase [Actinobacteria bacterium]|nr:transposase [Actinomycetota bacterium]
MRHEPREVTEIAESDSPDNPRNRAGRNIAEVKRLATEKLEQELENAFKEEVEVLLAKKDLRLRWAPHVRRTIGYEGFQLDLKVPRLKLPDGKFCFPPWFEELNEDPQQIELLRRVGVTTRNVEKVHRAFYGRRVRGTSPSSVSRLDVDAGEDALKVLEDRTYHGRPPIVAVSLDGTAVGNTGGTRTVMVVVGVKADGSRWLLDTFVAQHESEPDITPRLRRLVEKGISPDVYWVADSGAGIQAALKKIGAKNVGTCTTHGVGNATKKLPDKKIEERFRLKIYAALAADAEDVALARLDAVEAELRERGHLRQANSLRDHKQGMVVTQRLGLKGELRKQLRSTNVLVEGQNHTVKENFGKTSNWQDKGGLNQEAGDLMRLRTVAKRGLELERHSWRRLADPKALVDLGRRLQLGGLDWETIVARLPPSFDVGQVGTPLAAMEEFGRPGARWLAGAPEAIWFGAPEALAKLGVTAGAPVGADELARAMRGEHTTSGRRVRTAAEVNVVLGENDNPKQAKVRGVLNLEWQLTASPALMRRWRAGTEAQRAELEAAFWDAATAAMARATKTTEPGHGFAAAAVLMRPPPDAPEAESALRISGIGVGVARGGKKLNSPARVKTMSAVSRNGEDAAKAVLDRAFARTTAQPGVATHPPEEPSPMVLAGVEMRALEKAPGMVATADDLAAIAAGETAARDELGIACGEASGWWSARGEAAASQVAAAWLRDPGTIKRDPWAPLSPGRRLLLGEERGRALLGRAARLLGRASADAAFAQSLRQFDADPLRELETAVGRVEGLAKAIAARREIDRRELFERARAVTPAGERPPPEVPTHDSRMEPAKQPVERFRRSLGRRARALRRYSKALAPEVAELRPEQLRALFHELGDPWRNLDQQAGWSHAGLEERRAGKLKDLLNAEYLAGREVEASKAAEAEQDAGRAHRASKRHDAFSDDTKRLRGELMEIDARIEVARREADGLEAERFATKNPHAAAYDAAFVELQQRELAQARQTADVGTGIGL